MPELRKYWYIQFLVPEHLHRLFHLVANGNAERATTFTLSALYALAGMMLQCLVFGSQFVGYLARLIGFVEQLVHLSCRICNQTRLNISICNAKITL